MALYLPNYAGTHFKHLKGRLPKVHFISIVFTFEEKETSRKSNTRPLKTLNGFSACQPREEKRIKVFFSIFLLQKLTAARLKKETTIVHLSDCGQYIYLFSTRI